MAEFAEWLSRHSVAVVAIGSIISAIATVAIAFLSLGTWRLYKLERRRNELQTGALAAHLVHCAVRLGQVRGIIFEDESDGEAIAAHGPRMVEELREIRTEILRRFDSAVATSFEVAAAVDAAAGLVKDATRGVEFATPEVGWGSTTMTTIDQAIGGLLRAYNHLPQRHRRISWRGGEILPLWSKTFHDIAQELPEGMAEDQMEQIKEMAHPYARFNAVWEAQMKVEERGRQRLQ